MKDAFGQNVNVGDYVFCKVHRYRHFVICKVTRTTPKKIETILPADKWGHFTTVKQLQIDTNTFLIGEPVVKLSDAQLETARAEGKLIYET